MTERQKRQICEMRHQGKGYKAIAAELDLSRDAVRGYCKRYSLDGPASVLQENLATKRERYVVCAECGKPIQQPTRGRTRRFCSEDCRRLWWRKNEDARAPRSSAYYQITCKGCGTVFTAYGNKRRKYCSHACYITDRFEVRS